MTTTAHAVVYHNADGSYSIPSLHTSRDCAINSISPLEGSIVAGIATIQIETTPASGLAYRIAHGSEGDAS